MVDGPPQSQEQSVNVSTTGADAVMADPSPVKSPVDSKGNGDSHGSLSNNNNTNNNNNNNHDCHNHDGHDDSLGQQQADHPHASEREHLEKVCDSFRQYATFTRCARAGQAARFARLSTELQYHLPRSLLEGCAEFEAREQAMQEAELCNQFFFDSMLRHAGLPHSQDVFASNNNHKHKNNATSTTTSTTTTTTTSTTKPKFQVEWATDDIMDRVDSTLKSLCRDWSAQGAGERSQAYPVLLEALSNHLPGGGRVLVPGAGVGRLALEAYALGGYEVQGNEFSLHMLLASDFILNGTSAQRPFAISPWLKTGRNVCRADDPARSVRIPDLDPATAMKQAHQRSLSKLSKNSKSAETTNITTQSTSSSSEEQQLPPEQEEQQQPLDFSMAAGEFVAIYNTPEEEGRWNAVLSCFFLDTAPCIVEYLVTIRRLLADDGLLINFGPLHYHWTGPPFRPDDGTLEKYQSRHSDLDERYLRSVDMTWEDIREVMWRVGFEVVEERLGIKARYTADARNFVNNDYRCIFFVAKKSVPRPQTFPTTTTTNTTNNHNHNSSKEAAMDQSSSSLSEAPTSEETTASSMVS